jgi:hypothetical protein
MVKIEEGGLDGEDEVLPGVILTADATDPIGSLLQYPLSEMCAL